MNMTPYHFYCRYSLVQSATGSRVTETLGDGSIISRRLRLCLFLTQHLLLLDHDWPLQPVPVSSSVKPRAVSMFPILWGGETEAEPCVSQRTRSWSVLASAGRYTRSGSSSYSFHESKALPVPCVLARCTFSFMVLGAIDFHSGSPSSQWFSSNMVPYV